jgi:hypothetical protein
MPLLFPHTTLPKTVRNTREFRQHPLYKSAFGKVPDSHNYVQFLMNFTMKKIFFLAVFVAFNAMMLSCSADDMPANANTNTGQFATGGEGTIPVPPPPPPKP